MGTFSSEQITKKETEIIAQISNSTSEELKIILLVNSFRFTREYKNKKRSNKQQDLSTIHNPRLEVFSRLYFAPTKTKKFKIFQNTSIKPYIKGLEEAYKKGLIFKSTATPQARDPKPIYYQIPFLFPQNYIVRWLLANNIQDKIFEAKQQVLGNKISSEEMFTFEKNPELVAKAVDILKQNKWLTPSQILETIKHHNCFVFNEKAIKEIEEMEASYNKDSFKLTNKEKEKRKNEIEELRIQKSVKELKTIYNIKSNTETALVPFGGMDSIILSNLMDYLFENEDKYFDYLKLVKWNEISLPSYQTQKEEVLEVLNKSKKQFLVLLN